jgi:hypothetical protein
MKTTTIIIAFLLLFFSKITAQAIYDEQYEAQLKEKL